MLAADPAAYDINQFANAEQAIASAGGEFHVFMIRQTREHDLQMFAAMAKAPKFAKAFGET
jgi:flagellar biosynthetic protein FliP